MIVHRRRALLALSATALGSGCTAWPRPAVDAPAKRNPRFRVAEVDGHHNVMLIDPERLAAALAALG